MSARVRVIDDLPARAAHLAVTVTALDRPSMVRPRRSGGPLSSGLAGDARLNYTARDDVTPSGLPQEASE